jgi:hypothetical protein
MKTTLIVIENETDHADAKRLIEKLMGSSDSQNRARMVARLLNGPAWAFTRRSCAATWHNQPRKRGPERKAGLEHDNGAPTPRALLHLSRFARSAGSNAQQNSGVSLPAKIHDSYATTRYAMEINGNSYQCKRPTFHGLEAPAFNWR